MKRLGHAILPFLAIPVVIVIFAVLHVVLASQPLFMREVALGLALIILFMGAWMWLIWTGRVDIDRAFG